MKGIRFVSRFIFLHVTSSCFSTKKSQSFLHCVVKGRLTIFVRVYFRDLYFVPLIYLSVTLPVPHCLDYCGFIKSWRQIVPQLCSSPSILNCLSWVFNSPYKLQNHFINIHKITCKDFYWDYIESLNQIWKNWHLYNIESFYSWTWDISLLIYSLIFLIKIL